MIHTTAKTEQDSESCWQTPPDLVARFRDVLGGIDLDPCTTPANPVGATLFYAPPDDGILLPWYARRIYCNPPYGRTMPHWVEKCITAASAGEKVLLLVPGRSDNAWYHKAILHAREALLLRSRIRFIDPATGEPRREGGMFASVLFGFNVSLEPLADLGVIIQRKQ